METSSRWYQDVVADHEVRKTIMEIIVTVKSVYGNELVYPADDTARLFASLLKVKTFNAHQISTIRALGYTVRVTNGYLPF